ncbi:Conjugative transposon protein TraD [Mucinivorans hirudinis]|uniref:Conjugative transposon protein TraD n=1 Tax=Mucinivorans hirudinis TaxID=1433126 RepID=A0A060R6N5_9BACT|nr:Conjugative transposon protein TraD [Mucinivorans hirudinis]
METLLICLLLLYNAWLVAYILSGRKKKDNSSVKERAPDKPTQQTDEIVGKSRFKMKPKEQVASIPKPQAATEPEGEDITDIAVTFADENEDTPSARLSGEQIDEAFEDIRISDVPQEYDEDEQERLPSKGYASGASFEEIGAAIKTAENPSATPQERKQAGQLFSDMEGDDLFSKIIGSSSDRAKRISGLMDEILNKPISEQGEAVGVSLHPRTNTEVKVPADISGFDIRDFV